MCGDTLSRVTSIIEQTAVDAIATDLASHACMYGDPGNPDRTHNHLVCLEAPGAALADHLWAVAHEAAADDWTAARAALRRLDQAIVAGELSTA